MERDNEYHCDYPSDPNINNIKASKTLFDLLPRSHAVLSDSTTVYKFNAGNMCDIIKSFTIRNYNITELFIEIGGKCVYRQRFNGHHSTVKITPFTFGIPIVALAESDINFIVTGKIYLSHLPPSILCEGLLLGSINRKILAKDSFIFETETENSEITTEDLEEKLNCITIQDGKWHQNTYLQLYRQTELGYRYNIGISHHHPINYYCEYPEDPDVDKISATKIINMELCSNKTDNCYTFDIDQHGDIIKYFIIENSDSVTNVSIDIGGNCVYNEKMKTILDRPENKGLGLRKTMQDTAYIQLKPFLFGIPMVSIKYHSVTVQITSTKEPKLSTVFLELSKEDQNRLSKAVITFKEIKDYSFKNGMYGISNIHTICVKCENCDEDETETRTVSESIKNFGSTEKSQLKINGIICLN
mgnify:FL=1